MNGILLVSVLRSNWKMSNRIYAFQISKKISRDFGARQKQNMDINSDNNNNGGSSGKSNKNCA